MKKFFSFEIEKQSFLRRLVLPFAVIVLSGIVVYLGSIIGRFTVEQKSVEMLIKESEPRGAFFIPTIPDVKKWTTFSLGFEGVSFKYPPRWRPLSGEYRGIMREGEDAIVSVDIVDAGINGESMLAYRVARIAALQELKYPMRAVESAELSGRRALVLQYYSPNDESVFYETTFLERGFFHTIILGTRGSFSENGKESVVDEYRAMLATVSFASEMNFLR
ncbi:MAG: hypothetical protein AAB362_01340 [Patescibacteria group bacterium]